MKEAYTPCRGAAQYRGGGLCLSAGRGLHGAAHHDTTEGRQRTHPPRSALHLNLLVLAYIHIGIHTHWHTHWHTFTHWHTYTLAYTLAYIDTLAYIHIGIHIGIHLYIGIHTHWHTHWHTYTLAYMYTSSCVVLCSHALAAATTSSDTAQQVKLLHILDILRLAANDFAHVRCQVALLYLSHHAPSYIHNMRLSYASRLQFSWLLYQ